MGTPVWAAQSKTELRRAYQEADEQQKLVDAAYIAYMKAAKVVSDLYEENGSEVPLRRDDPVYYKKFQAANAEKKKMFVAWQREAQKHGAMFVKFMDRPSIDPQGGTVWSN